MEEFELHIVPEPERTSVVAKIIVAAVLMAIVIGAVFLLNPQKTAEVTVEKVDFINPHTQAEAQHGSVGQEIGLPPASEDDLYVVATVKITDKLRLPIVPNSPAAILTLANGTTVDGSYAGATDLPRLEQEFPDLTPLVNTPGATLIETGETIAPESTRTGKIVLLFSNVTKADWDKKKAAELTVNLFRQKPLTVALP